jgi:hypothetical protein
MNFQPLDIHRRIIWLYIPKWYPPFSEVNSYSLVQYCNRPFNAKRYNATILTVSSGNIV